ncbi:MAG: hypothetical protein AAFX54_06190 [Pseudomonadota bacterium]
MCVAPGSQFFWIGLALLLVLGGVFARTLVSLVREFSRAATAEARTEVVRDHASSVITHGLWFSIMIMAAGSCGVGLF